MLAHQTIKFQKGSHGAQVVISGHLWVNGCDFDFPKLVQSVRTPSGCSVNLIFCFFPFLASGRSILDVLCNMFFCSQSCVFFNSIGDWLSSHIGETGRVFELSIDNTQSTLPLYLLTNFVNYPSYFSFGSIGHLCDTKSIGL